MAAPPRRSRLLPGAMAGAVLVVVGLAYLDLRREQARALEEFSAGQIALAAAGSVALEARLDGTLRDLGAAAAGPGVSDAALKALVEPGGRARAALYVEDGAPRRGFGATAGVDEAVTGAARLARARKGAIALPATGGAGVVALAQRSGAGAVVLLVDGERLLEGVSVTGAPQPPQRWLLLADRRLSEWRADPARRSGLAGAEGWRSPNRHDPLDLAALFGAMEAGARGAATLSRDAAESLGMERRMAVAGYAPVRGAAGGGWSIAAVASAMNVRDRARVSTWRLIAATVLAGLLVGLFGWVGLRQQRHALGLEQALRLAESTSRLREELVRADKLATIGTLAAGVAHELGTPLGIISGRAEQLLERADPADETLKKGLASVLAQVEKVSTTIRQLLDFARVRPVEAIRLSPAQALATPASLLEHRFRQAKVALSIDAPASLPAVAADPTQLEQVFVNLLLNAVDACPAGGHVIARAAAEGDRVVFEIADDGCGIAPEHLRQVLDPFFTTKKRGQGTGLGLTIAADIVKNHGGALEIDSAPGRGTTVRVRLPRADLEGPT